MSEPARVTPSGAAAASIPWTPALVRVMAGLMLSMFVAAIDSTVVGTALPTIARDLNGFSLYPWVFTGYLLTGTTSVPIWGRLPDLYGRRRVLLAGLSAFVLASVLCGASPNMPALVVFRTLQGLGAGCLQPVTQTVVGDVFPVAQRARLQGLFSGMWALAAIVGPLVGAGFVATVGWRWIFVVNLPVGIAAAALLWAYKEESGQVRARGGLNLGGSATLTLGLAALLLGLGAGNSAARPNWAVVAAGGVLLAGFALIERRGSSPTIPFDVLRRGLIGPAILLSLLTGTVMFGLTAFIPLLVQSGLGGTAFQAGAAVAPMSLGWPIASVIVGRILLRAGFRRIVVAGSVVLVVGTVMLLERPVAAGYLWLGLASAVVGAGMGLVSTPVLILIQSSVPWDRRGAVTALNQFSRTIGGAAGVSVMGVLLQLRVAMVAGSLGLSPSVAANPLEPEPGGAGGLLITAGVEGVFWVLVALAALTLLTSLAILLRGGSSAEAALAR